MRGGLIDQWMSCIDKGDLVGKLFLDLRKAFDVVDSAFVIKKKKKKKIKKKKTRCIHI